MYYDGKIWLAKDTEELYLLPQMANRHGLIAGATGTGKTTTLKVMAESFSDAGVPTFLSDIKGDLTGMCQPGIDSDRMQKLREKYDVNDKGFEYKSYPTQFWDVFGKKGTPVRATVSEMGPLLISRAMGLTDVQEGVLNIAFKVADDEGMLLLDLKDLRSMVQYVGDNAADLKTRYGNIASASIGAIQRGLLKLETEGAEQFFGEPALDIHDWLTTSSDGRGTINILNCEQLFQLPELYSTFMLWMLSELYETMPEVGDLDKPKAVFFFDEAHLLFDNASRELLQKVEQVVRLIRSKGVGVYFITQAPSDIPDSVLGQLGNKIQHALRAYTPADQKAVKAAAQSFRVNPDLDTAEAILACGTGEACVSFLDEKGVPSMVHKAGILMPQSFMGPADQVYLMGSIAMSEVNAKYKDPIDRESAYEILNSAYEAAAEEAARIAEEEAAAKEAAKAEKEAQKAAKEAEKAEKERIKAEKEAEKAAAKAEKEAEKARKNSLSYKLSKEASNFAKNEVKYQGRKFLRGILGSLGKKK